MISNRSTDKFLDRTVLARLARQPAQSDLGLLLSSAGKDRKAVLALPFQDSAQSPVLVLSVTYAFATGNHPRWCLFAGEDVNAPMLWNRDSNDVAEIEQLLRKPPGTVLPVRNSGQTYTPQPIRKDISMLPAPIEFDKQKYLQCLAQIKDPESSLYSEGAFFWFVTQEFSRYQRTKCPFSLILIGLCTSDGFSEPIAVGDQFTKEAGKLIQGAIRQFDYVCRYGDFMAALLYNSSEFEAQKCAERINDLLLTSQVARALAPSQLKVFQGIAGVPETCEHPGTLISACIEAIRLSRDAQQPIVVFGSPMGQRIG